MKDPSTHSEVSIISRTDKRINMFYNLINRKAQNLTPRVGCFAFRQSSTSKHLPYVLSGLMPHVLVTVKYSITNITVDNPI